MLHHHVVHYTRIILGQGAPLPLLSKIVAKNDRYCVHIFCATQHLTMSSPGHCDLVTL